MNRRALLLGTATALAVAVPGVLTSSSARADDNDHHHDHHDDDHSNIVMMITTTTAGHRRMGATGIGGMAITASSPGSTARTGSECQPRRQDITASMMRRAGFWAGDHGRYRLEEGTLAVSAHCHVGVPIAVHPGIDRSSS